jgi:hypothetical protein
MKKIALLLIVVSALSCKKDKQVAVNGIPAATGITDWTTTSVITGFKPLDTKDTLFIVAQKGEENIVIALKQKGVGTYQPAEFNAWYYTTVGLDAVVSKYQLYSDAGNWVTITDYNETGHSIKGTFSLLFKSTYKNGDSLPDEVKFTNGKIDAALSDTYIDPLR